VGLAMALVLLTIAVGSSTPASASVPPPVINISSPTDGAHYAAGSLVLAHYSCDGGAFEGDTCIGTVPDGSPIDTGSAGVHTFTVEVHYAIYVYSKSVSYTVDAAPGQIVISSPANGKVYDRTLPPVASYSCTPGTVAVTSCVGTDSWSAPGLSKKTVVANGKRIPALVGKHTFTVVATDASGNTTSAARSFTVIVGHKPDAIISGKGDNVYGNITPQTVTVPRGSYKIPILIQNDGSVTDRYKVKGDGAQSVTVHLPGIAPIVVTGWTVRYYEAGSCAGCVGREITRWVVGGTYLTSPISPKYYRRYYMVVVPTPFATPVSRTVTVTDPTDSLSRDAVRASLK